MARYGYKSSSGWSWVIRVAFVVALIAIPLVILGIGERNIEKEVEKADQKRAKWIWSAYASEKSRMEFENEFGNKKEAQDAAKKMKELETEYAAIVVKYPQWGLSPKP